MAQTWNGYTCPECGFSDHEDSEQVNYCERCGHYLDEHNYCENKSCFLYRLNEPGDEDDYNTLSDQARFCPYCGEPSAYSRQGRFSDQESAN